ncbi:MAG: hypothetical protein JNN08_14205 [Bryobacterales bacterium]|nr:hypothetical protein [Bryobacterales bacterium]
MKVVTGLIALVLICVAAPCWAQPSVGIFTTIPFEFAVNDRTLPAGEYATREIVAGVYEMVNTNGDLRAFSFVDPVDVNQAQQAKLVFRKYGDKYFLAEVWNPLRMAVLAFPKCRKERELVTSRLVSAIRVDRVVILAQVR